MSVLSLYNVNNQYTNERKSEFWFNRDSSNGCNVQYNLNGSNTDGSFTVDDSVPAKFFQ